MYRNMPTYTLLYFDIRGVAEVCRMLFRLAGMPFIDKRLTLEEWLAKRNDMPFSQVPVLLVDDLPIPQSHAIARYLALQFGFAGTTPMEQALVDGYADLFKDYWLEAEPYFRIAMGDVGGNLAKARKEIGEPARDKLFTILEEELAKSKSGFLVGDGVTWVDLLLADHVDAVHALNKAFFADFPRTMEHLKRVYEIPEIKLWVQERPKTVY